MNKHVVKSIDEDSIAKEVGIEIGDELISINGVDIEDVIDYKYLIRDEEVEVFLFRPSTNEEWEIFIEKEDFEDLGIEFESGLMDEFKACHNKCVFCFIDQLPEGMRETMYFKDDDARLSFLQGNYITLTNMKEKDFARIINYRLSPINISIHTMNMELRVEMLKNRFANKLIGYMDRLNEANITMNGQIVLCKGINDEEELDYSIQEMMKYHPNLQSVSVVPVGLTKHRDHLQKLEPFTKEDALKVIERVLYYQQRMMKESDCHFIHAADEFYFLAGLDVPQEDTYDGYLQYENGVGMTRLLKEEFKSSLEDFDFRTYVKSEKEKITIVTGKLIEPVIKECVHQLIQKVEVGRIPEIQIVGIENHFFGERITVSGLVTGGDIIAQLKEYNLGEIIYIPNNMLKSDEDIFLDDITLEELIKELATVVVPLELNGDCLFEALLGKEINHE